MLEAHIAMESPKVWNDVIVQRHGADVKVLDWMHMDGSCCEVFVEIRVAPGDEQALLDDLAAEPTVQKHDLNVVSPGVLKGALSTDECLGSCSAMNASVFQLEGRFLDDGRLVQVLVAPDRDSVKAMIANMEAKGHKVTLLKLATADFDSLLTSRQETILLTALERGFFDNPKGTSLHDLAETFGVSISTASEMLRKATFKVMSSYFGTA